MNENNAIPLLLKVQDAFSPQDAERIRKALFSCWDLGAQRFSRPVRIAELLIDHQADADTVITCLLAPKVWFMGQDPVQLEAEFGPDVARTLHEMSKPFAIRTDSNNLRRQDIDELLASFASDTRKAVLMLFFRLDALEHPECEPKETSRKLAKETLDLYVPLAGRLGLNSVRIRLEDVSFSILEPDTYHKLCQEIEHIRAEDDRCLQIILQGVRGYLKQKGIEGQVQGRTKGIYSIYRKMCRHRVSPGQIMDRIGARIIVPTVFECYVTLGLLHTHFRPIPGTFDDYIGLPKDNGYQSLHTCIYPLRDISSKPIEFQIRTPLMHMEAEFGLAAHWRYKCEPGVPDMTDQHQSRWIQSLVHQHKLARSSEDFIHTLHKQVFENSIVVFSNGGQMSRLPEKATVRDYLQKNNMRSNDRLTVKINGQKASLDNILQDGDSIEIMPEGSPEITYRHNHSEAARLCAVSEPNENRQLTF